MGLNPWVTAKVLAGNAATDAMPNAALYISNYELPDSTQPPATAKIFPGKAARDVKPNATLYISNLGLTDVLKPSLTDKVFAGKAAQDFTPTGARHLSDCKFASDTCEPEAGYKCHATAHYTDIFKSCTAPNQI